MISPENRPDPIPTPALDDAALAGLVDAFYVRVRTDPDLGAMFNGAIAPEDWPAHLGRMAQFWSSVMLSSGAYHGNPVAAHMRHRAAMDPSMFARWLALWEDTARQRLSPQDALAVQAKARRIAESLQLALFFCLPRAQNAA